MPPQPPMFPSVCIGYQPKARDFISMTVTIVDVCVRVHCVSTKRETLHLNDSHHLRWSRTCASRINQRLDAPPQRPPLPPMCPSARICYQPKQEQVTSMTVTLADTSARARWLSAKSGPLRRSDHHHCRCVPCTLVDYQPCVRIAYEPTASHFTSITVTIADASTCMH